MARSKLNKARKLKKGPATKTKKRRSTLGVKQKKKTRMGY